MGDEGTDASDEEHPLQDVPWWRFLGQWRGRPDLVAHIARVMVRSVEQAAGAPATCVIAVVVLRDVEEFHSADDFVEHLTASGLKWFSRLEIVVSAPGCEASAIFKRRAVGDVDPAMPKGVHLSVTAGSGPIAAAVGQRIVLAVERGSPADALQLPPDGRRTDQSFLDTYDEAIRDRRRKRRRALLLFPALGALALGSLVAIAGSGVMQVAAAASVAWIYAVLLILFVFALDWVYSPPVEIAHSPRNLRLLRAFVALVVGTSGLVGGAFTLLELF